MTEVLDIIEAPAPAQPTPRPRVGFVSLGCPKNLVDSEVMMGLLDRAGAQITADADSADILVVNTCSFIDKAKQESVDAILEMARLKTNGSARKLIVAGCLVERYRDEIQKNIPEVDAVVGTGELESILEAAGLTPAQAPASTSPFNILGSATVRPGVESRSGTHRNPPPSVPKAIAAKSRAASYAPIGMARLRSFRSISTTTPRRACAPPAPHPPTSRSLKAATTPAPSASSPTCAANSAPAASNPSSPKPKPSSPKASAKSPSSGRTPPATAKTSTSKTASPCSSTASRKFPGLTWLRFLYAYPNRITGKLLETIAKHDNICKYLDVPLQHAAAPGPQNA